MLENVPEVTRADVERVVRRTFSVLALPEVLKLLDTYGPHPGHVWKDRVHLAILRLSNGSFRDLERNLQVAKIDPRDVISGAENPRILGLGFAGYRRLSQDAPEKLAELQKQDWEEYQAWLGGEN